MATKKSENPLANAIEDFSKEAADLFDDQVKPLLLELTGVTRKGLQTLLDRIDDVEKRIDTLLEPDKKKKQSSTKKKSAAKKPAAKKTAKKKPAAKKAAPKKAA